MTESPESTQPLSSDGSDADSVIGDEERRRRIIEAAWRQAGQSSEASTKSNFSGESVAGPGCRIR